MFRVYDPENDCQVFTKKNPREDGFTGEVEADVVPDYNQDVHLHRDGEERPKLGMVAWLYKVRQCADERYLASGKTVGSRAFLSYSWNDYLKDKPAPRRNSRRRKAP